MSSCDIWNASTRADIYAGNIAVIYTCDYLLEWQVNEGAEVFSKYFTFIFNDVVRVDHYLSQIFNDADIVIVLSSLILRSKLRAVLKRFTSFLGRLNTSQQVAFIIIIVYRPFIIRTVEVRFVLHFPCPYG